MARLTRHIATRLALAFAGAGLAVAGAVLLLRVAWLALSVALGTMAASLILGGALLLTGALGLALSTRPAPRSTLAGEDQIVRITTAFFRGLAAGRAAQRR